MKIHRFTLVVAFVMMFSVVAHSLTPPRGRGGSGVGCFPDIEQEGSLLPGETPSSVFERVTGITGATYVYVTDLSFGEHSLLLTNGLRIDYVLASTKPNAIAPNFANFNWSGSPGLFVCGAFVSSKKGNYTVYQFPADWDFNDCGDIVINAPHIGDANFNSFPTDGSFKEYQYPPISQIVFFVCPIPSS
jgi:hypothetical protein